MVKEGATVVIADIRPGEGKTLADQLGEKASFAELDVTNEEAWSTVVADVVGTHGRLDVLVNCAGILTIAPLVTSTLEDFQKVTAVNQYGVYLGMRAALSPMLAAGKGCHRQHLVDRRGQRHARHGALLGHQARRDRPHPVGVPGGGGPRDPGQRRLPGPHAHPDGARSRPAAPSATSTSAPSSTRSP